jgi:glycosyltransferase involved in cell wall biosynthesis
MSEPADGGICVVVATRGRPALVGSLLAQLAEQTRRPDHIFVVASEPADVAGVVIDTAQVTVAFERQGLAPQRNKGLALAGARYDYVAFFDDDFIPSRFWLESAIELFNKYPKLACITGKVLADGIKTSGIPWKDGATLVASSDAAPEPNTTLHQGFGPYGCNMMFRAAAIKGLTFDERLPLYAWLEDADFGARVARHGLSARADCLWGVHLGIKVGRVRGSKLGYSQIVNPVYLVRKGSISLSFAANLMARNIIANAVRSLAPEPMIDRRGRLFGNLIGIADVLRGRITPERAAEL